MDFGAGDSNDKGTGGGVAAVSGKPAHRADYRAITEVTSNFAHTDKICTACFLRIDARSWENIRCRFCRPQESGSLLLGYQNVS
jgi:hypothetical protein